MAKCWRGAATATMRLPVELEMFITKGTEGTYSIPVRDSLRQKRSGSGTSRIQEEAKEEARDRTWGKVLKVKLKPKGPMLEGNRLGQAC